MRLTYSAIRLLSRTVGVTILRRQCLLSRLNTQQRSYTVRAVQFLSDSMSQRLQNRRDNSYEDAVRELNNLQSNAAEIQAKRVLNTKQSDNIQLMEKSLSQLNITIDDLDRLNIVHIAGTKGKGSTAALTESILRHHGYKTGFFSSPHLIEVRERIRLGGAPISQQLFTKYFWEVFNTLKSQLEEGDTMPPYFKFLTLLAFRIFMSEGVDAAVIEVGIGGRFDSTNVTANPVCCAITSLGIDHTFLLGDTLEEISWQKAGIFKTGCPAVTVAQKGSAMSVLRQCSEEVRCPLYQAPPFDVRQRVTDMVPRLGIDGEVQLVNASLAVQVCRIFLDRLADRRKWMTQTDGDCTLSLVELDNKFTQGLSECRWPGRFHRITRDNVTYYLDGAHTTDSVAQAFKWFRKESCKERKSLEAAGIRVTTALLFNKTGLRSGRELLESIAKEKSEFRFDIAVFSPNTFSSTTDGHSDTMDRRVIPSAQLEEVISHRDTWISLTGDGSHSNSTVNSHSESTAIGHCGHATDARSTNLCPNNNSVYVFPSLSATLGWLGRDSTVGDALHPTPDMTPHIPNDVYLQVFITGSLYLVGNSLCILKETVN